MKLSQQLFGWAAEKLEPYLEGMKADLKRAKITKPFREYVADMVFLSAMAFVAVAGVFGFILGLVVDVVSAAVTALTLSMFSSLLVFSALYFYPSLKVAKRVKEIEENLPFAAVYMSSLAAGNVGIKDMMRIMASMGAYGELRKEFEEIVKGFEMMGHDVGSAIERVASTTPSPALKEMLFGLYFNILSGSDLYEYLAEKAESLMAEYLDKIKRFSQQLNLFIEIYLTLIIIGSVFFIVLSSVMGMIGGGAETVPLQFFIVFIGLPLISVMFALLFSSMSPG